MRLQLKGTLLLAAALALAAPARAQAPPEPLLHAALGASDNWTINGGIRVRIDGIDGQFRPVGLDHDVLLSIQSRLFAEYDTGPVRIGGEIIDARAYFQTPGSSVNTSEVNAAELAQAYLGFDLGDALGAGSTATLTAGRMTANFGSRRLVARALFRNSVNAFTGLRFDWTDTAHDRLTLFWFLPHTRMPGDAAGIAANGVVVDREGLDLQLFGGSFTKAGVFGGSLEIYGYGLLERDAPGFQTSNRRLFTPGIRLFRAPHAGAFDWDIEAIYQLGTTRGTAATSDLRDLTVGAYFVRLEVGRGLALPWAPRLALIHDRASGNGRDPNRFGRFDTLFGARRADLGPSSLYGAIGRANLSSIGVRADVTPGPRWDAFVGYRALWLESRTDSFSFTGVRDPSGRSGSFAGHQIEGRVRHWIVKDVLRADLGAAFLLKSDFLRRAPNGRDNGDTKYGYLDVTWGF